MNFIVIPKLWDENKILFTYIISYLDLIPQQLSCHSNNLLRNSNNKNSESSKQTNHLNMFRLRRLNGNLFKLGWDGATGFFLHAQWETERMLVYIHWRKVQSPFLIGPQWQRGMPWANWLKLGLPSPIQDGISDWFRLIFFSRSTTGILGGTIFHDLGPFPTSLVI